MSTQENIWLETKGIPLPNPVTGGFTVKSMWAIAKEFDEGAVYFNVFGSWGDFHPETTLFFENWQQAESCAKSYLDFKMETKPVSKTPVIQL